MHVEEKWQSIYEHLEAAPEGNKAQIFLTFSSGAGVFAYPRAIAQRINAQLYGYLRAKNDLNQRLGIICMDFPAAPIIQMIIDFQFEEATKRRQAFNPALSKGSLKYAMSSLRKKMDKHFSINIWTNQAIKHCAGSSWLMNDCTIDEVSLPTTNAIVSLTFLLKNMI